MQPRPDQESVVANQDQGEAPARRSATGRRGKPGLRQAFRSLGHRDYRLFLLSGAVVSFGMWMEQVAQGWLVLELTNSPFYLGLVGFSRSIPVLFFALVGGVLADRFPRRTILLFTRGAVAVLALVLALLITTGLVNVWWVLVIAAMNGIVQAVNQPARNAFIYDIVGETQLMNAIVLNSAVNNSARVVGPSLAGIVIATVGIEGAFYIKAVAFGLAVIPLALILVKGQTSAGKEAGMVSHLTEGFDYIKKDRTILTLILLALIPMIFAQPYLQLMPVFARDVLAVGPEGLGVLMSFAGIGALIGAVSLAFAGDVRRRGLLMLSGAFLLGAFLASFSLSQWWLVSLVLIAGVGCMNTGYLATNNTLLQTYVRDDVRGRVMGVYNLDRGLVPLGSLFAGTLASLFGAPVAVFTMGSTVMVLVVVVLFAVPRMRRVD